MKRLLGAAAALALCLGVLVPAAIAAPPLAHTGRVLISTEGDVTVPAGDHADVVVVVEGNAEIRGEVNTLVVVEGTATLVGATLETVVAVNSQVEVGADSVIYGEVQRLESTVHQAGNAVIQGGIVDLGTRFLEVGAVLGPALMLLWIGFALSTIVAGLLLAALAARQLRAAERLISREPVLTGVTGLLSVILIPIVAILLFPTLIGAPLGFGILVVALPLVAFGGYLVAAVWIGERLLGLLGTARERERPYVAVALGVVVLGAIGLVPVLGLVTAIASLFGFGAVILLAIRTIVTGSPAPSGAAQQLAAPSGA
jgi:hypothetical protein